MSEESSTGDNEILNLSYGTKANNSEKLKGGNDIKLSPSIDYQHINSISPRNYNLNTTEKTFETILSEDEDQVQNDNQRFTPIDRPTKSKLSNGDYLDNLSMLPNSALNNDSKKAKDTDLINFGNERYVDEGNSSSSSSDTSVILGTQMNMSDAAKDYYNSYRADDVIQEPVLSTASQSSPPKYFSSEDESSDDDVALEKECVPYKSTYDAYYILELSSNIKEVDWIETTYNLKIQDEPQNKSAYDRALLTLGIGLKSLPLVYMVLGSSPKIKRYYSGLDYSLDDAMKTLHLNDDQKEMDAINNFLKYCYNNKEYDLSHVLVDGVYDNFVYYIICLISIGEHLNSELIRKYISTGYLDDRLLKNGNWPVGLFNMGNTCYLNSLLQYYFAIQPLKNYILSYKPLDLTNKDLEENELMDSMRCQDFVIQIQKLYKDMINTPYRISIPPNELIYLVFAPRGGLGLVDGKIPDQESLDVSIEVGRQQDVTECMLNYMDQLEKAVVLNRKVQGEHFESMSKLFNGSIIEGFRDILNEKIHGKQNIEEEFTSILISLHDKPKTLHEALEHFFNNDEEVMELKEFGQVKKQSHLKKLPDILQIQVQRVEFNKEILQPIKNNFQMEYPEILYVDRYVNGVVDDKVKDQYKKYQEELKKCEEKRLSLRKKCTGTTSVSQSLSLRASLSSTIKCLQFELQDNEMEFDKDQINQSLKLLSSMKDHIDMQVELINTRISYLNYKIANHYNEYQKYGYELFAAFMHRGEADYGHYWIYIKDGDMWRKYNDEDVEEVLNPKDSVFNFDIGNMDTAYYLGYVRKDKIKEIIKPLDRNV